MPHAGDNIDIAASILPRFALTVGIVGHRTIAPGQLARIQTQIKHLLLDVKSLAETISNQGRKTGFFGAAPCLRLASCLSEGSDREAAQVAMQLGYSLQAFLPFPMKSPVHANDLPLEQREKSRSALAEMCDKAESVLELNPEVPFYIRSTMPDFSPIADDEIAEKFRRDAYLSAGLAMLDHSDILMAIWSGKAQQNDGSTYDIICRALARKMPVCIIRSNAGCQPRVVCTLEELAQSSGEANRDLAQTIQKKWGLGNDTFVQELNNKKEELRTYGLAKPPKIAAVWKWFETKTTASALKNMDPGAYKMDPDVAFNLFDKAANYCASMHRSSFLWLAILSMLAVAFAAIASVWPAGDNRHFAVSILGIVEVVALVAAIITVENSKKHAWQALLTEFRLGAEVLRLNSYAIQLGLATPYELSEHSLYCANTSDYWLTYILRNSLRERGLASKNPADFEEIKDDIRTYLIHSQYCYHKRNEKKCKTLAKAINNTTSAVFILSLIVVGIRLTYNILFDITAFDTYLAFFGTILPVIATSSQSILQYAELDRLATRSGHISGNLDKYVKEIDKTQSLCDLQKTTLSVVTLLIRDVQDWKEQCNRKEISYS